MTLYILSYNNYYNRLVKSFDNMEDYEPYVIYTLQTTNFSPNDGINTQHVIGAGEYDGTGDYLIALDDDGKIVSRWFIIDSVRTRAGQYNLTLRRDLVVDYYNIIVQSPMFIEKATLDQDSPFIFNKEDMTVNQIKTNEHLLKDKSNCAWIVGYYDKDKAAEMVGTVPTNPASKLQTIQLDVPISQWEYYKYSQGEKLIGTASTYDFTMDVRNVDANNGWRFYINKDSGAVSSYGSTSYKNSPLFAMPTTNNNLSLIKPSIERAAAKVGLSNLNELVPDYVSFATDADIQKLFSYQGLVKDIDGKIFDVVINTNPPEEVLYPIASGSLFILMSQIVENCTYPNQSLKTISGTPNMQSFNIRTNSVSYTVSIVRRALLETTYDMSGAKLITTDAPYNIFAIPFGPTTVKNLLTNEVIVNTTAEIGLSTAMGIQKEQASRVYDIQLLPYCPIPNNIESDGVLTVSDVEQYSLIKEGENTIGIIFNVPLSRFNQKIPLIIDRGYTSIERKLNNECDKWRLASPNYSSYFDFSAEMNDGVEYFDVDCDYKPFVPYIHVNPNFKNLYGYDDNSPRGLILSGDFSLPQIINQWQQYQVQNKNFQNIFDRQIQNMEVQNKYQREMDRITAVVGTIQGGASGASTALISSGGNPYAAIAGAAVGTVASGIAGYADVNIKEKLRNEAMDYTKDLFGYQLGNIQALPNTISKVSALNGNNKLFPVLEYYTCTDAEKKALLNKIAYNGMTVMIIGTVQDYLGNSWNYKDVTDKGYLKGQLIKFNDDGEDLHVVNEIAAELNKGVYIKQ